MDRENFFSDDEICILFSQVVEHAAKKFQPGPITLEMYNMYIQTFLCPFIFMEKLTPEECYGICQILIGNFFKKEETLNG